MPARSRYPVSKGLRGVVETICFGYPPSFSPLTSGCQWTLFLGGTERCIWTIWWAPTLLSACTQGTSLLSLKCYFSILPVGSDVYLTLRPVYQPWGSFCVLPVGSDMCDAETCLRAGRVLWPSFPQWLSVGGWSHPLDRSLPPPPPPQL